MTKVIVDLADLHEEIVGLHKLAHKFTSKEQTILYLLEQTGKPKLTYNKGTTLPKRIVQPHTRHSLSIGDKIHN